MKKKKRNVDTLPVTEHVAVTQTVFSILWQLKLKWKCKRLSDVILSLIKGEHRSPGEWENMVE